MERDPEALQFVVDHIDTVPHLEALLLIWQNQATTWDPPVLASRIYVSEVTARGILDDLVRMGFMRTLPAAGTYTYATASQERDQLVPRLADLYRRQLVQVTKLIHSKGSNSVREFARAFQIKKDH